MKAGTPSLQSTRLLDPLQVNLRSRHYSLNIVKCYLFGVNYFSIRQPTG
jgi:hypothetical protein